MLIRLPTIWTLILNIGLWPVIQLAMALLFNHWPSSAFSDEPEIASPRTERFFERVLLIRLWKDRLPDGGRWLAGGFAKGHLSGSKPQYIREFIRSTRAGEWCHIATIAAAPVFFLWNPPWADAVMAGYALLSNLPCIFVQRYNRGRLSRLLQRQQDAEKKFIH